MSRLMVSVDVMETALKAIAVTDQKSELFKMCHLLR